MNRDEEGVHPIANTENPGRLLDIVFVHGLRGGSHSTWTHEKDERSAHYFWPEHLGKALPDCGIWTVGYAAGITKLERQGMIYSSRGVNLAHQMCNNGLGARPLIFITHSMGGLVIKSLLVKSRNSADKKYKALATKVRGIIFCGTPHSGSDYGKYYSTVIGYMTSWTKYLAPVLGWNWGGSLASWLKARFEPQQHVIDMSGSSTQLVDLSSEFIQWCQDNPVEVMCYAELHAPFAKGWLGRTINLGVIVPDSSALIAYGIGHRVDSDHFDLVKPHPERKPLYDTVYKGSLNFIQDILNALTKVDAVDDFSARPPSLSRLGEETVKSILIDNAIIDLNTEKEAHLKTAQKKILEGHFAAAEQDIRELVSKTSSWSLLTTEAKAKAYRLLIQAVLNRQSNTTEARKLLSQAKAECPGERFVTTEAFIAITEGSEKDMLESYPTPVTSDEWRWKLLLLINDDQYSEAIQAANDPAAPFPISDMVHGCLTWAYLGLKQLDEARKANDIALKSNPNGLGNLEAKAVMDYACAISPESGVWLSLAYPLPVELECLLTTSEAIRLLTSAAAQFEELANRMDGGSVKQIRYLMWSMACWCNLVRVGSKSAPKPAEEAARIFKLIQDHQLGFPLAVHWALLTRLPVDLKALEELYQGRLAEGKHDNVEILCQLYLHQGREAEAAELMDRHKASYSDEQARWIWRHYRVQLAGSLGQHELIESIIRETSDEEERLQLRALSLRVPANRGDFKEECMSAYRALWSHTKKPTDLFSACAIHVQLDAPDFAAQNGDNLLKAMPTRAALQLVLSALTNAKHWQRALDTLKQWQGILANDELPVSFMWMEFECLYQTGRFPQSLALMRKIVQIKPTGNNIITWFNRATQAGDHQHMIEAAQTALQKQSEPEHLLHMADQLAPHQPELSRQLFDAATKLPQFKKPHTAAFAFLLAHRLGISDGLDPSIFEVAASPGGPMKRVSLGNMIEMQRQWQKERNEQEEHYRLGKVFVHAYVNATGHPISAIYHDACPLANSGFYAPPTQLWSARIRHGRRHAFMQKPSDKPWKLHLDITSLLLAHRLGVLSTLEKTDAILSFSPRVPGILLEELKKLSDRQPERVNELDQLLGLVAAGRIRVTSQSQVELPEIDSWASGMAQSWKKAFSSAVEHKGVLIDFWPWDWDFEPNRPLEVPEKWQSHVGGPSGLVQGILDAGWLEESEISPKMNRHDSFIFASPSIPLVHGSMVILEGGIAGSLLNVGALDALTSNCQVWITYEEEQQWRDAQRQAKYRDEVFSSVETLQRHLQAELGRRYQPSAATHRQDAHQNDSPLFLSVLDLLEAGKQAGISLVAEDRWMSGYLHVGEAPIIGVLDVLYWLYKEQQLSASNFFGCLHRLRLGNARFIPISEDELLYRLKAATHSGTGELRESPELEAIRRYYAASFLDAKSIQLRTEEDMDKSEFPYLVQVTQVVGATFAALWVNDDTNEARQSKAHWLLHGLFTDVSSLTAQLLNPSALLKLRDREFEDLFCLFCMSVLEHNQQERLSECAGSFASWLIQTLKLPQVYYRRFFEAICELSNKPSAIQSPAGEAQFMLQIVSQILKGLLKEGSGHLTLTAEEKQKLGFCSVMPIGEVVFERTRFWEAVTRAMDGEIATIEVQGKPNEEYQVSVRKDEMERAVVCITDGSPASRTYEIDNPQLASSSKDARLAFLHAQRTRLDLRPAKASVIFGGIAGLDECVGRIDQYAQLEEESTTVQFERFMERCRHSQINLGHIEKEAMPLGAVSLLRHVGLESGDLSSQKLPDLLSKAAPELIDDYGLEQAFVRQASLPVKLPDVWAERIFNLTQTELDEFIQTFDDVTCSPLLRLQLACLLLRRESGHKERGMALLDQLIGHEARDAWSYFRAVLHWSWRSLSARSDDVDQEEVILSAWLHAGVLQFWLPRPVHSPGVIEAFSRLEEDKLQLFAHLKRSPDFAHPLHFSATWLITHVLPQLVALDDLPEALAGRLVEKYQSMLVTNGDFNIPIPSLTVYRKEWANSLSSFLEPARSGVLNGWASDDQQVWIDQDAIHVVIQRHCEKEELATAPYSWIFLSNAISAEPCPQSLRVALQVQLDAFSFSKLQLPVENATEYLVLASNFIAAQKSWYRASDDTFWTQFVNDFVESLEKLQAPKFEEYALSGILSMSIAWGEEPSQRAKQFADLVIQMVRKRNTIAMKAWELLSRIVQAQKSGVQSQLWPMLAEVRALAGR